MLRVDEANILDGESRREVSRLLEDYLLETEGEKALHGLASASQPASLPAHYQSEVDDPGAHFAGACILTATQDRVVCGMVIAVPGELGVWEIKRLWVDPPARGTGVGSALLQAALTSAAASGGTVVRLTVWSWRESALRAYRRFGFTEVASWDERNELTCMELRLAP